MSVTAKRFALLLLLVTAACATANPRDRDVPLTIEVSNQSWSAATVHLISGAYSRRVATVDALTTQIVHVPGHALADSRAMFLVRQRTEANDFRSDPVSIRPGSTITLTIGPRLSASHLAVR